LSNGLLTAVANDSGVDAEPFEHMLRPPRSVGIVINLGRKRPRPPDRNHIELGISQAASDVVASGAGPLAKAPQDAGFLYAAFVQAWGHVIVRLARSLLRTRVSSIDDEAHLICARHPIAPQMQRHD
jgi:hypothetical protein